jgi:hypothetical protein
MADITAVLNQIVPSPTIVAYYGGLYSNIKIPSPTFVGVMNDGFLSLAVSQPTFVATLDSEGVYTLNKSIPLPTLRAKIFAQYQFESSISIGLPRLDSFLGSEVGYHSSLMPLRPIIVSVIDSDNNLWLSRAISRPIVNSLWVNDVFNDTATVYAFNTFNSAHTQYTNFGFNSYFKLGSVYYGINSSGIHRLDASLDGTTQIQAEVHVPISDYQKQGLKACTDAILLGRLEGDFEVITVNDEQEEREGFIVRSDDRAGLHRIRVKIHKGLKGSVWQYKLKNVDGSNFAINNLEVYLKELSRIR